MPECTHDTEYGVNVKIGLFMDDDLGWISPLARWFYLGLCALSDRSGCLEERPRRLKAMLLPYDDGADVAALLEELEAVDLISRDGFGEGEPWISIPALMPGGKN